MAHWAFQEGCALSLQLEQLTQHTNTLTIGPQQIQQQQQQQSTSNNNINQYDFRNPRQSIDQRIELDEDTRGPLLPHIGFRFYLQQVVLRTTY
jgi:hypothetical protein